MDDVSTAGPDDEASVPRWFAERTERQRLDYASHFVRLAEQGDDVDGEARFVDALAPRGATILDAGCGVGRVAARLSACGHHAAGVDADPILIGKGHELYPGLPLTVLDLTTVAPEPLIAAGLPSSYDVVVSAGNVMHFVADGTEPRVLAGLATVLRPGGRAIFGFATGRAYSPDDLDRHAATVGWSLEHRFGTWQCDPFSRSSDWALSVYRAPGSASA